MSFLGGRDGSRSRGAWLAALLLQVAFAGSASAAETPATPPSGGAQASPPGTTGAAEGSGPANPPQSTFGAAGGSGANSPGGPSGPSTGPPAPAAPSFLDENPSLKKYIYREPDTHFYFGFGASPVTVFHNRFGFDVSVFQIHYMSPSLDWEIFNAAFGFTLPDTNGIAARSYTFRTVPKWRLGKTLSVGPLLGYEFVSFPTVTAYLEKSLFTPVSYPFSAGGPIYGFAISETFDAGSDYKFKINELGYMQNYSTTGTSNGWKYYYDQSSLNADQSPIAPGWVFSFEFSFLY